MVRTRVIFALLLAGFLLPLETVRAGEAPDPAPPVLPRPTFHNTRWISSNKESGTLFPYERFLTSVLGRRLYVDGGMMHKGPSSPDRSWISFATSWQPRNLILLRAVGFDDRRKLQWYTDGRITVDENVVDPKTLPPTGQVKYWAGFSQYSPGWQGWEDCYKRAFQQALAQIRRGKHPIVGVANEGDYAFQAKGPMQVDYSPFALKEFRDWLTHRGIYRVETGEYPGWFGGEDFADDPSPAEAKGNHPPFNKVFGTNFTTWRLKFWDPDQFPDPLPWDAPGMPGPGQKGHIPGGFDAPRERSDRLFYRVWNGLSVETPGFRQVMHRRFFARLFRVADRMGLAPVHLSTYSTRGINTADWRPKYHPRAEPISHGFALWPCLEGRYLLGLECYSWTKAYATYDYLTLGPERESRVPRGGWLSVVPLHGKSGHFSKEFYRWWFNARGTLHFTVLCEGQAPFAGKDWLLTIRSTAIEDAWRELFLEWPDRPFGDPPGIAYVPPPVRNPSAVIGEGTEWRDWAEFEVGKREGPEGKWKTLLKTRESRAEVERAEGEKDAAYGIRAVSRQGRKGEWTEAASRGEGPDPKEEERRPSPDFAWIQKPVETLVQEACNRGGSLDDRRDRIWALGIRQAPEAVPALLKILANREEEWLIRETAVSALLALRAADAKSCRVYSEILRRGDEDPRVRQDIVGLLVRLGVKGAKRNLEGLAKDKPGTMVAGNLISEYGKKRDFGTLLGWIDTVEEKVPQKERRLTGGLLAKPHLGLCAGEMAARLQEPACAGQLIAKAKSGDRDFVVGLCRMTWRLLEREQGAVHAVGDPSEGKRRKILQMAVPALGQIGGNEKVNLCVRELCLLVLAETRLVDGARTLGSKAKGTGAQLQKVFKDPGEPLCLRRRAAVAMGALGFKGAWKAFEKVLSDPGSNPWLRRSVAEAMGGLDLDKVQPLLLEILEADGKEGRRREHPFLRSGIATVLGEERVKEAESTLRRIAADKKAFRGLRWASVWALGEILALSPPVDTLPLQANLKRLKLE
ncbi:MAG: HEAT repeat domain-containing protein [Planctomycetota bacterium]